MFHTDVNVFHCVICVGIVKHKGFLDLLMMMGKFLDLGAVALDRSLKRKLSISWFLDRIWMKYIVIFVAWILSYKSCLYCPLKFDRTKKLRYLVNLELLDLLFQSAVHFKGDANNLLCLLLDPGTDGIGLLGEFEAEFEVLLFEEKKTILNWRQKLNYLKFWEWTIWSIYDSIWKFQIFKKSRTRVINILP